VTLTISTPLLVGSFLVPHPYRANQSSRYACIRRNYTKGFRFACRYYPATVSEHYDLGAARSGGFAPGCGLAEWSETALMWETDAGVLLRPAGKYCLSIRYRLSESALMAMTACGVSSAAGAGGVSILSAMGPHCRIENMIRMYQSETIPLPQSLFFVSIQPWPCQHHPK
jgi:hypothetical protein